MVPPDYGPAPLPLAGPVEAWAELTEMRCEGRRSVLAIGDTLVPEHRLRIANGYDDSYDVTPARLLRNVLHLGYRKLINHYVGMSHYFRLGWNAGEERFVAQAAGDPLNAPCRRWHEDFAARAKALNYNIIWSLSYELFDAHAPESWKQRAWDGSQALTGWSPPSTLLSPANDDAMEYLRDVGRAFIGFSASAEIGRASWRERVCQYV